MENQLHSVSDIEKPSEKIIILLFCVVLLCVFTFLVPCCGVLRFLYKMMFGLSLSQVVYKKTHVLFTLFVFLCVEWCPTHIVCFVLFLFILCLEYPVFPVSFLPLRFSLTFIYKPLNTITEFFYQQQWSFSTQQKLILFLCL